MSAPRAPLAHEIAAPAPDAAPAVSMPQRAANAISVRLPSLDELARRWAEVEPILLRATQTTGCYAPVDVLRLACTGQMAVWLIERGLALVAVAVTEPRQYPRRRILEVPFIAGGGIGEWHAPLLAALEDHARALGCRHIAGSGRRGWGKFGFETVGVIMVRSIR